MSNAAGVSTGPPAPRTPKWKRELRLLRRKGLRRWWSGKRAVRRFHRAVDEMVEAEGGGHDD